MPTYYSAWQRAGNDVVDMWVNLVDEVQTPVTLDMMSDLIKDMMKKYRVPKHQRQFVVTFVQDEIFKICRRWYPRLVNATRPNYDGLRDLVTQEAVWPEVMERLIAVIDEWEREFAKRPPPPELAALALDNQNVHTVHVNEQTDNNIAALSKVAVPKEQRTLDEILTEWLTIRPYDSHMAEVMSDMRMWGKKSQVIKEGDYAYRVLLRNLWAKIKTFEGELRMELVKRLWEECEESVGMCAQGHLSRLSNVLVGYVADYKPPENKMEVFQDRMAKIAAGGGTTEEKIAAATEWMDQIEMPAEERGAWLEAF